MESLAPKYCKMIISLIRKWLRWIYGHPDNGRKLIYIGKYLASMKRLINVYLIENIIVKMLANVNSYRYLKIGLIREEKIISPLTDCSSFHRTA